MNRLIFSPWSDGLNDKDFCKALASLGVLTACHHSRKKAVRYLLRLLSSTPDEDIPALLADLFQAFQQVNGRLSWQSPSFNPRHDQSVNWLPARVLASAWGEFLEKAQHGIQLRVLRKGAPFETLLHFAKILHHSVVGASSVVLAAKFSHATIGYPTGQFRIRFVPTDHLADSFRESPRHYRYGLDVAGGHDSGDLLICRPVQGSCSVAECIRYNYNFLVIFGCEGIIPSLRYVEARFTGIAIAFVDCASTISDHSVIDGVLEFVDELGRGVSFDLALERVFGSAVTVITRLRSSLKVEVAPANLTHALLPGRGYVVPEKEEKTAKEACLVPAGAETVSPAFPPGPPRFIQHRLLDSRGEDGGFLAAGTEVTLKVRIAPYDRLWQSAPRPFPDQLLPKGEKIYSLQVVFFEPAQMDQPLIEEILLPRTGISSTADFAFTPREPAPFLGRITVLHRGRILQTALVQGTVYAPGAGASNAGLTQEMEAQIRTDLSGLHARRHFDLALVFNHTVSERPMLTAISANRAYARDLAGIDNPVSRINAELSNIATSVADYSSNLFSAANHSLFARLARIGSNLYNKLFVQDLQKTQTPGWNLEEQEYIQVVTMRPDAMIPLEFLYHFTLPKEDAKICSNAVAALKSGKACTPCDRETTPRDIICPLGFWGLTKVIERHVYNPNLATPRDALLTVQAEPLKGREQLDLGSGAVFGYSKEVSGEKVADVIDLLKSQYMESASFPESWNEWRDAVRDSHPTLLVAYPHNEGSEEGIKLEIHDDFLETGVLPSEKDYVHVDGTPYPLAVLLGCDVAGTAQQYASHVVNFREAGAAVVISTIATVFGEHATAVGEKLISRLLDQSRPNQRLGELLREVKREALIESLPMALCVVAFGDADWKL
ncbi:hypothetical protein KP005_05065 [Geomonas nitrogeniifigens]|uniref:CHAT domain-containing protein n=1 Tax=Geomonas diazotrophica TaxID=2843197 RepID=A0ABX8JJV7_9BACT|nr:hypothetical protein [Geomonas nitrogeniifigens]QWV98660.1 hypothetical protein KP005_05065 [Geomonas nitrogeniifigens]